MSAPRPIVHLYVLLDRSGSMASMAEQVVAGFNRLLAEQQADGHDARMTLVQFDSEDPREVLVDAIPLAEVVPLRPRRLRAPGRHTAARRHRPAHRPGRERAAELAVGGQARRAGPRRHHHRRRGEPEPGVHPPARSSTWCGPRRPSRLDLRVPRRRTRRLPRGRQLGYDPGSVQSFAPDGTGADARLRQPLGARPPTSAASSGSARPSTPATSSRATSRPKPTAASVAARSERVMHRSSRPIWMRA